MFQFNFPNIENLVLKNIFNRFIHGFSNDQHRHFTVKHLSSNVPSNYKVIVTFSGGIGAQILSAAVYFYLERLGFKVYADMTYFAQNQEAQFPKMVEGLSFWPWNLNFLGIPISKFHTEFEETENQENTLILPDNSFKFDLGIEALGVQEIAKVFKTIDYDKILKNILPPTYLKSSGYGAIHIRRGDYLNVASYIVPDSHVENSLISLSKITQKCLVVSDSLVVKETKKVAQDLFDEVIYIEEGNLMDTDVHILLTKAKFLFTSNSQFSLTAALLSDGICFIPKQWFSGAEDLDQVVNSMGEYQLLSR